MSGANEIDKSNYIIYTHEGPFLYTEYPGICNKTEILTTKYRGICLHYETLANPLLNIRQLQNAGYKFIEIHCLSSITKGEPNKPGNPSGEHGRYIWTQAVMKNDSVIYFNGKKGDKGPWVYVGDGTTPDAAARDCALHVLTNLCWRHRHDLRIAVFGYDAFQQQR